MRIVLVGGRTAYAASGYLGAKHLIAGLLLGALFAACGAALVSAGWMVSRGGAHGFTAIIPLGLFAMSLLIGGLIGLFGAVIMVASICECLTSHICWVDAGLLYHATSCAGLKRTRTFSASTIEALGAAVQSWVNSDTLYLVELRQQGERMRRPLLKSLREDDAKRCLSALRADLGRPDQPWAPRQIARPEP